MNARDIRLMAAYTGAIESLCKAQKDSYSETAQGYLSSVIEEISKTMKTDLAGHVDPDVVPVTLSQQERAALQKFRKCEDWHCSKCGANCLLRHDLFKLKET